MKKEYALLILTLVLNLSVFSQWSWQYPIPQGNRLNDMTFFGADNLSGYAIGNFGTILNTTNKGLAWDMLDSITANNLNGFDFINENLGFAVGDNGTILQSTSFGTWEPRESGTFYNLFDVAFATENKAFAVGYKGLILKSGSEEWSIVNSGSINTLYGIAFATPEIGIIVGDTGFIYRTADGGASWSKVNISFENALNDVYFPSASIGYIVGNGGLILKTTDAGLTWTDISYFQAENNLYSVHFVDDTLGYVSGATGLILSTTNGGANWAYKAINTSLSFNSIYLLNPVADTVCDTIIFCGDNGLIQRTDSCTVMNDITHGSSKALNTLAFYGDTIAYAVGGHLFNNTPLILHSNDGKNWEEIKVDTIKRYLTDIVLLNADTGYISGRNGRIYRADSALSNWVPLVTGVSSKTLYSVRFVEPNKGMAVGEGGTVIRSISGDTTWEIKASGTTKNLYKLYYKNLADGGYAVGADGIILRIKNNGSQITKIISGTNVPLYDIKFPTDTVGFIVGYSGKIIKVKVENGVETLTSIPSGVTTPLNEIFFPTPQIGYIAGEGGVILKSTDGGNSWLPQYTGTANNLRGLYFKDENKGYAIGSGPSIIITENGGGGVITPFVPEQRETVKQIQLYPNPAANLAWIEYELEQKSFIRLTIFDLSGRQIHTYADEIQHPGHQKKQLNVSTLKKGIYIVILQAGKRQYAEKLIILN